MLSAVNINRSAGWRHAPAVALIALMSIIPLAAPAATPADLYSATVIVTGKDNLAERARGIRAALPLVLTKVAADTAIGDRAAAPALADRAEELVERLDYRDRKEGIQISDEQGTRDRSFELTVYFEPAAIDTMVEELGGAVWTGDRPEIAVALTVDDGRSTYLVTETSEKGYGQRLALHSGAASLALPVVLPKTADEGAASGSSSGLLLEGHMTMTAAGYWNTEWHLEGRGIDDRFGSSATTFDVAIDKALQHSAAVLAKR